MWLRQMGDGLCGVIRHWGSPARSARTVSESIRTPILSLGATSSSIACMIEGTPAITMTLPIQNPGAPDTLLRTSSAALGMRVMRSRASFISAALPERIECIDDRFLLIADDPHCTTQGGNPVRPHQGQNIGYCRGISDGGRRRLAGQLRLQLEAALEAAPWRTRPSAKRKSPYCYLRGTAAAPRLR